MIAVIDWTAELLADKRAALHTENIRQAYADGFTHDEIISFGYGNEEVWNVIGMDPELIDDDEDDDDEGEDD